MHLFIFTVIVCTLCAVEGARLPGCDIVIEKDGTVIENGGIAVAVGGQLNQVYCKVTCSESGATPALKWWDDDIPVPWTRGRKYQVRAGFERMNILTIRNALHRDMGEYKCTGWVKGYRKLTRTVKLRFGCGPDAHLCDSSKCVDKSVICDGTYDCKDRTDEMNCNTCHGDQFQCDEKCIPKSERCDGFYDCRDLSDEADCGCGDDFTCSHMENCVTQDKVCDGVRDCMYGDDEHNCTYCSSTEFHCGRGRCISENSVCDGIEQCDNGSDERNCPCNGYTCTDGTCIPSDNVRCNGIPECPLNDDEEGCVKLSRPEITLAPVETIGVAVGGSFVITCEASGKPTPQITWRKYWSELPIDDRIFVSSQNGRGLLSVNSVRISDSGSYTCEASNSQGKIFAFPNTNVVVSHCLTTEFHCGFGECISDESVCDGTEQCADGSDERNCPCEGFQCYGGTCIESSAECNGTEECPFGDDEKDCVCSGYQCSDGTCIDQHNVSCNGTAECPLGDDENNCTYCSPYEFHCGLAVCIPDVSVCDGIEECADGSDELNCPCTEDEFTCNDGKCINLNNTCDGKIDCNGSGEDEDDKICCKGHECSDGTCILSDNVSCNGIVDCPLGDDETDCVYCLPNEFHCGLAKCIQQDNVCDRVKQCTDGSDELNCTCYPDQFKCNDKDGKCVDSSAICDGVKDCPNNADEKDCPLVCSSSQFKCKDESKCIPLSKKCDGQLDCGDASDECDGCYVQNFVCDNGLCIDYGNVCNAFEDCPTGEDEHSSICPGCKGHECSDGTCILSDNVSCNGIVDCPLGDDETDCVYCLPNEFHCGLAECIPLDNVCDRVQQCTDGSDEMNCTCYPDQFKCNDIDGKCVDSSAICDGTNDCPNNADEQNCPLVCSASEFKCKDESKCISLSKKCDGQLDCDDASDECDGCYVDSFVCNNGLCIDYNNVCNAFEDCPTGEDENSSICQVQCPESQVLCSDESRCISESQKCDSVKDCDDGSDEGSCTVVPR